MERVLELLGDIPRVVALERIIYYLFDLSPDPVVIIDKQGHIVALNKAAEELMTDVKCGVPWLDLVAPDQRLAARAFLERYVGMEGSRCLQTEIALREGRRFEAEIWHLSLNTLIPGTAMLSILFSRDVSDRASTARLLADVQRQLEREGKSRREFVAAVSHELRTPLNGILGMSEILLSTELSSEQRSYLELLSSSGKLLLLLVNDILDFAKAEASKLVLQEVSFDLRNCLDKTLALLATNAYSKGLELIPMFSPNLPHCVTGDEGRIRQVIINLVANAIKFTHTGQVVVRANAEIIEADTLCRLRVEVEDTGIGIAASAQDRIFEPFGQAHENTAKVFGGTGLGLSLCKTLVKCMGGVLGVNSAGEGEGSTFWFEIMLAYPTSVAPPAEWDFTGKRFLCVSGNPSLQQAVCESLRVAGSPVIDVADDAETARQLLKNSLLPGCEHYDVMLLDGVLSAAASMRDVASRLELVVLSDLSAASKIRQLFHPVRIVTKPFTLSQLCGSVASAVPPIDGHGAGSTPSAVHHPKQKRSSVSHSPGALRVLVAEDNPVNQQVTLLLLQKAGHTCAIVSDGQQALVALASAASKRPFDVVLMDRNMPRLDGCSATSQIRQLPPPVGTVRIVATSASGWPEEREKCLSSGADAFLLKPFNFNELCSALSCPHPLPDTDTDEVQENTVSRPPVTPKNHVDWAVAEELTDGDAEAAAQLRQTYLQDLKVYKAELSSLAEARARTTKQMHRIAHTLKSSSGAIGAGMLAEKCSKLDVLLNKVDEELEQLLSETAEEAGCVISELS